MNYSVKRVQSKLICIAECENNRTVNNLFIRYKAEAILRGKSIQNFCLKNKVSYNLFHKWYKDTRHHIVPVQIEGQQLEQEPEKDLSASAPLNGGALLSSFGEIHVRHPYNGWNAHPTTELKLQGFEGPGREVGRDYAEHYRHEQVLLPEKLP